MADVVYLHPLPRPASWGLGDGAAYPIIPVGLVGHVNLLRAAGHSVVGLDMGVERTVDPGFKLCGWLAKNSEPDVVLIDLHWYEHAWGALHTADEVRRVWAHSRILLGGLTASHFAADILRRCPAVDGVIAGAAEQAVLTLCAGAQTAPNTWTRDSAGQPLAPESSWTTPQSLLDRLDTVDLGFLRHAETYRAMVHSRPLRVVEAHPRGQWVLSGRGCAFACGYCGGGREAHRTLSGLKRVSRRDPRLLAADFVRATQMGVQQVAPSLDPDMLGRSHLDSFFANLSGWPGLYVESYQLPSGRLLSGLAERCVPEHSELALTPLSGSEAVRRAHGKRYDNDQLVDKVRTAHDLGLNVFLFFSINLPGETEQTLSETVALARRLLDQPHPERIRAINIAHTVDPMSPMAMRPGDFGVSQLRLHSLDDYIAQATGPRPFTFAAGERGFELAASRDLPAMVAAWDALASEDPRRIYRVPRV